MLIDWIIGNEGESEERPAAPSGGPFAVPPKELSDLG